MNSERPERTATVGGGLSTEPSPSAEPQPQVLLVYLGNVRDLTLGASGNQTKDGKYFYV